MHIYESAENYLEAILIIQERRGSVRSIDIANELNFSKPSVSVAMKKLRESGYVEMDADGSIRLLPAGHMDIVYAVSYTHLTLPTTTNL